MTRQRGERAEQPQFEPKLRVLRTQVAAELAERIRLGEAIRDRELRSQGDLDQLKADFQTWGEVTEQLLRSRFTTGRVADDFAWFPPTISSGRASLQQEWTHAKHNVSRQLRKLDSITKQLELYDLEAQPEGASRGDLPGTKVFVVHGHDGDTKQQVARFLETILGERPVILHEQPNGGARSSRNSRITRPRSASPLSC